MKRVNGILLLDKPEGMPSAALVSRIKRLAGGKKTGHAGTLDPFASGLMIILTGQATRLSRFFLHGGKTYDGVIRLGVETDTLDGTGTETARHPVPEVTTADLADLCREFTGEIRQQPPAYSALKQDGVPLYRLARRGKPVFKPPRTVRIHHLSVTRAAPPDVHIRVTCSGGTYIRTLAADMGRRLGCGAHLGALRRTASGPFHIADAATLEKITEMAEARLLEQALRPMTDALPHLPVIRTDQRTADRILTGRPLPPLPRPEPPVRPEPDGNMAAEFVQILGPDGRLLAVLSREKEEGAYKYSCVFNEVC
ncbi:MAG: tRNA pseudouridine(55) synthase TruB [Desulfobacterales bacterium]|nr:MAG: tRNA pseudouridine(55) synthase TruB [Desulfobacterales bacterium]